MNTLAFACLMAELWFMLLSVFTMNQDKATDYVIACTVMGVVTILVLFLG
jgi:hypothetical protein